jgi:acyl carrier protein
MTTLEKLNGIFQTVFDNPDIVLRPEMTANDIDGWDSISHENLILALERGFAVRFTPKEQLSLRSVGDLLKCLEGKLPSAAQ